MPKAVATAMNRVNVVRLGGRTVLGVRTAKSTAPTLGTSMELDGVEPESLRSGRERRRTCLTGSTADASATMPNAIVIATEPSLAIRLPDGREALSA
jgi:hypothetical protein